MSILYIFLGFLFLVVGGEFLVRSSVGLSFKLKLSKMVIALTVVSFATSAPELIVSLQAALKGFSDIALGNVIGSNIANIGLVLGITAVISALDIDRDFYKFNWPVMMLLSILLYIFLLNDNQISRLEGGAFILALVIYIISLITRAKKQALKKPVKVGIDNSLSHVSYFKIIIWLVLGGIALWGGSELLVFGAVDLATQIGISERVIAVTVIAIGTSVPELAASIIAALKKEKAISLGNLIGSNIFNIASVLGLTAIIEPIVMQSQEVLTNDLVWMLGYAVILIPLAFIPKRFSIGRYKGLILVVGYGIFLGLSFLG